MRELGIDENELRADLLDRRGGHGYLEGIRAALGEPSGPG
jgi:hypothetical protein